MINHILYVYDTSKLTDVDIAITRLSNLEYYKLFHKLTLNTRRKADEILFHSLTLWNKEIDFYQLTSDERLIEDYMGEENYEELLLNGYTQNSAHWINELEIIPLETCRIRLDEKGIIWEARCKHTDSVLETARLPWDILYDVKE